MLVRKGMRPVLHRAVVLRADEPPTSYSWRSPRTSLTASAIVLSRGTGPLVPVLTDHQGVTDVGLTSAIDEDLVVTRRRRCPLEGEGDGSHELELARYPRLKPPPLSVEEVHSEGLPIVVFDVEAVRPIDPSEEPSHPSRPRSSSLTLSWNHEAPATSAAMAASLPTRDRKASRLSRSRALIPSRNQVDWTSDSTASPTPPGSRSRRCDTRHSPPRPSRLRARWRILFRCESCRSLGGPRWPMRSASGTWPGRSRIGWGNSPHRLLRCGA